MTFTHCELLARIPPAFSDQVAFPACVAAVAGAVHLLGQRLPIGKNLTTSPEWSRTTALTARSAYVKTLVSRPVILTRKKVVLTLAIAAALTMFGLLEAQQGAPTAVGGVNPAGANASKYNVAVVDISYIFKKHERFKGTMEGMKKEAEGFEVEMKAEREKIAQQEQQRNAYNPGTAEFKQFDEQIARKTAEFQLKAGKFRKDFLEREAKVYYQTYLEVVDAITQYSQRQNIGLVLRFNGETLDPNKRDDVLREINKPVVMQDRIDITPDIIVMLNRTPQGVVPAGQQGAVPPGTARVPSQLPVR
jgi:Skp family chaperone for outer membrane proteins